MVGNAETMDLGRKASVVGEGTGYVQPTSFPGSQTMTCRQRTVHESTEPLTGCLGVAAWTHSEDILYKPCR